VVGISVLTLVPGELGGSETDARELLRGNHERLFEASLSSAASGQRSGSC